MIDGSRLIPAAIGREMSKPKHEAPQIGAKLIRDHYTAWTPWFVAHADDKRRARLNITIHLLSKIPYEELPRPEVQLPPREPRDDYKETDYPFRLVPEVF